MIVRQRAKARGLECDLSPEDIVIPEKCPVFGFPLNISMGQGAGGQFDSPSVDRIDNEQGYIRGNIQVMSHLANRMKSSATRDQLQLFARWILR